MLVLTRKNQEKIRIGDHITITVLRMKGKAVRLGIEAPTEVPVVRGELVFEVTAGEPQQRPRVETAAQTSAVAVQANVRPAEPRVRRLRSTWPAATKPELSAPSQRTAEPGAEVHCSRIPRQQAAQFVGRMAASESAPLRAMLHQRSAQA